MDRPNVVTRISKLKSEIERLRILATDCHPAVSTEITSLADDMNSRRLAHKRRFIAFDSFAGIVGSKSGEGFVDGGYAASVQSLKFANFIAEVPGSKVVMIEGAYQHTLRDAGLAETRASIGETQAAVVHIDCDVEEPAKLALDFVTPYLRQGTLLLFDEFDLNRADNTKGERAALRAWLKEHPDFDVEPYRCYHVHARSFILHKK